MCQSVISLLILRPWTLLFIAEALFTGIISIKHTIHTSGSFLSLSKMPPTHQLQENALTIHFC
jgi:hypothetical protein